MKRFLTLTALCALGVAAPASAQYIDSYAGGSAGVYNRIAQLETALQADIRAGVISRGEEFTLRRQIRDLRRTADIYARNGFSQRERVDLNSRFRTVRHNMRLADNGRLDRFGYADDLWVGDNGYYGQGGPYEDVYTDTCINRGGIAGVIDNIVGSGCLRVGMRANNSLTAVPYDYRYRYRDSGSSYFRSDGRSIYEIDARTNTIVRIYPMDR